MIPCQDGVAKTLVRLLEEEKAGWRNSAVVGVMKREWQNDMGDGIGQLGCGERTEREKKAHTIGWSREGGGAGGRVCAC